MLSPLTVGVRTYSSLSNSLSSFSIFSNIICASSPACKGIEWGSFLFALFYGTIIVYWLTAVGLKICHSWLFPLQWHHQCLSCLLLSSECFLHLLGIKILSLIKFKWWFSRLFVPPWHILHLADRCLSKMLYFSHCRHAGVVHWVGKPWNLLTWIHR